MIVWYETYNTHPKDKSIIGLCATDIQYREHHTDWCCEMAEENLFTDVKGSMGSEPKCGTWHKEYIRNLQFGEHIENIVKNKIPSKEILTKCPYCNEFIVYKNINETKRYKEEPVVWVGNYQ